MPDALTASLARVPGHHLHRKQEPTGPMRLYWPCAVLAGVIALTGCSSMQMRAVSKTSSDSTAPTTAEIGLPTSGQRILLSLRNGDTIDLRVTDVSDDAISGVDSRSGAEVRIASDAVEGWQKRPSTAARVVVIAVVAAALLYFIAEAAAIGALLSGAP